MKRSLFLFLAILLALTLFSGCGGTAAVFETEAPTEPPTFFEEQGFQEWEGFTVEADPEVREIRGTATIPNAAELFFYKKEGDTATEILHKEIIEADVDVHIAAYNSDEFGMEGISDVVDSFYQKAVEDGETMTKEEWLAAHEDYVVYNCWNSNEVKSSSYIEEFLSDKDESITYGWAIWDGRLYLTDKNTGNIFSSDEENPIGRISISSNGKAVEIFTASEASTFWHGAENATYDNLKAHSNLYVMAPRDYDGFNFMLRAYKDYHGTDEEALKELNDEKEDEESSGWELTTYQEYKEEYPNETQYFFAPERPTEEDTRPAPAVGTFFERMGIEVNMEKFGVTESVSDSNVKETHWKNSISIPAAEVLYFNAEKYTAKSYVDKKLANGTMNVYAWEYPASQFTEQEIQGVINSFYNADSTGASKQEWLKEHQDYKLVHFSSEVEFWVGHCTSQFFTNHNGHYWYRACTMWPKLIDKYSGEIFMPQSGNDGVVEKFEVGGVEFTAMNTQKSEWYQPVTQYKNYRENYDMYVLLPADYDGLIYSLELYKENRSDEEILALFDDSESTESAEDTTETEEETSTWWSGHFYEEDPYLKRYYFIPAN